MKGLPVFVLCSSLFRGIICFGYVALREQQTSYNFLQEALTAIQKYTLGHIVHSNL